MAAVRAVFETYELLDAIIAYLPPAEIGRAKRVAKSWNNIITTSKHIWDARCMKPTVKSSERGIRAGVLKYDRDIHFTVHPQFHVRRFLRGGFTLSGPNDRPEAIMDGQQFLTNPPCTTLYLAIPLDFSKLAKLEVFNGITLDKFYAEKKRIAATDPAWDKKTEIWKDVSFNHIDGWIFQ